MIFVRSVFIINVKFLEIFVIPHLSLISGSPKVPGLISCLISIEFYSSLWTFCYLRTIHHLLVIVVCDFTGTPVCDTSVMMKHMVSHRMGDIDEERQT